MSKRFHSLVLVIIIITMFFSAGCRSKNNNNKFAYISANTDSQDNKTFQKIQLGVFFDFNLKLTQADKSWVTIWVEGYSNGKAVEPLHLIELSYGLHPKKEVEEQMGLGILNYDDAPRLFLLSGGARTGFRSISNKLISRNATISGWDYAIGNKPIGIEPGEEVILAVYRQVEGSFMQAGYDYTNADSVKKMISENKTVLILKIKVQKK